MQQPTLEQIFGSYMAWKVDEKTWIISFMNGTEYMFLLEGEEKALLIDTGYGVGNLRAFVEKLTEKPILVTNTHYHPDHAAGNGEYDLIFPNHNGGPIAREYLTQYIELVDAVYAGKAVIEDKLNHPFIEMDEKAPTLCRVRWKNVSIFIKKDLLMTVYGKGGTV